MGKEWEWNWKTGTLVVMTWVIGWLALDIISVGRVTVSVIRTAIVNAICTSGVVTLLWWQQERKRKEKRMKDTLT